MSSEHLHLILNHLPVSGILFGCILLGFGLALKSDSIIDVSLFTFIAVSIVLVPVYFTGTIAEDSVDVMKKELARAHALAGELAAYAGVLCGIMAYITYFQRAGQSPGAARMTGLLFIVSFLTFLIMTWAAWSGGRIGHG